MRALLAWLQRNGFPDIPEAPMNHESSPVEYRGPWRGWKEEYREWKRAMGFHEHY